MFSSRPSYQKLKTHLRLALNRLKLLEKKKTELTMKARREIADYIQDEKCERARIRVEHIIREDYLVEAMEIVEAYCDLLLARFGLLEQMKELDDGLAEAVSSLIWVAPRLQTDVPELKLIGDQLTIKYGKAYGTSCRENTVETVSPKLMQKLSVHAPPKLLVENYLIEISKIYNVDYEPDHMVFEKANEDFLIDIGGDDSNTSNNLGGGGASGGGSGGSGGGMSGPLMFSFGHNMPLQPTPALPENPPAYSAFQYPTAPSGVDKSHFDPYENVGFNIPIKPNLTQGPQPPADKQLNVDLTDLTPKPASRSELAHTNVEGLDFPDLPDLPSVPLTDPSDTGSGARRGSGANHPSSSNKSNDDKEIDFDDLTRRFEELKKRK